MMSHPCTPTSGTTKICIHIFKIQGPIEGQSQLFAQFLASTLYQHVITENLTTPFFAFTPDLNTSKAVVTFIP